jgi:hypothetical protein
MIKKFRNLLIILFAAFFLVLSSGIVITLHECCTQHHHAKSEHSHCHETKIFIKIEGEFIKSEIANFSFQAVETALFFSFSIPDILKQKKPLFQLPFPPLLKFVGVNFVNFTSKRVLYS